MLLLMSCQALLTITPTAKRKPFCAISNYIFRDDINICHSHFLSLSTTDLCLYWCSISGSQDSLVLCDDWSATSLDLRVWCALFELMLFEGCGVFYARKGFVKAFFAAQEKTDNCTLSLQNINTSYSVYNEKRSNSVKRKWLYLWLLHWCKDPQAYHLLD